jgi:fructokinase
MLGRLEDRFGLKLIVLTKGSNGSRLFGGGEDSFNKGYPAEIADTVGAGDSFTAVVAMGLLQGARLDEINDHANRVASFVCSQNGATPELPESLVLSV